MLTLNVHKTIGFDFDQTLVDSSRGIIETIIEVLSRFKVQCSDLQATQRLSLPLSEIFVPWSEHLNVTEAQREYMKIYTDLCLQGAHLLPGVLKTLDVLKQMQIKTIIVSAKKKQSLEKMLMHFELIDIPFVADVFLDTKATALIKNQCSVYVGDHPNDVYASRIAGCKSIVTLTGNSTKEDFRENQPDLFLKNLVQFAAKPIETLNI